MTSYPASSTAFGRFEWRGVYFDGRSAARHEVAIVLERAGLRISGDRIDGVIWPFVEIRQVDSGAKNEPIRLTRGAGEPEVLVVSDPGFLSAVRRAAPDGLARAEDPGKRLRLSPMLVPIAVAALVMLVVGYLWGIPYLAERTAQRVPLEWEVTTGRAMLQQLPSFGGTCVEPARVAAITRIVDRLTAEGRGGRYTYTVRVIDSPMVNALAAPGGQIVVFHGLISQAGSAEELAGVLGHEIQHIRLQHGTKAVLREIPLRLLASAISGSGSFGGLLVGTATSLGGLRYQRRDEESADREGMRMVQAAKVAPSGMLDFFERTTEAGESGPSLLSYVSSHPRDEDRRAALEAMVREATYVPVPLLTATEWAALRAPCTR